MHIQIEPKEYDSLAKVKLSSKLAHAKMSKLRSSLEVHVLVYQ